MFPWIIGTRPSRLARFPVPRMRVKISNRRRQCTRCGKGEEGQDGDQVRWRLQLPLTALRWLSKSFKILTWPRVVRSRCGSWNHWVSSLSWRGGEAQATAGTVGRQQGLIHQLEVRCLHRGLWGGARRWVRRISDHEDWVRPFWRIAR